MPSLIWIGFLALLALLLALDLGAFNRRARTPSISEALAWTAFWMSLALAFNLLIFELYGHHWLGFGSVFEARIDGRQAALEFFAGFLLEKSLSVDNILVIALIFVHFRVPLAWQHRVLHWGVLGAVLLRGAMIAGGSVLIERYAWVPYFLAAVVLVTAVKLMVARHDNFEPDRNPLVRWLRRRLPVTDGFDGDRFFSRLGGRLAITPLGICLAVVATADLVFAIDSIPAVFAITRDPFLVFTSNVFALLGLRSLYFALAGLAGRLRYIKSSMVFLLSFIGIKMLLSHVHEIPTTTSLAVIASILGVGVAASFADHHRPASVLGSPLAADLDRLLKLSLRQARRVIILLVGSTVVLIGVAMIVLPGPAIVVIPAGLGILAIEFVWARRWLRRLHLTVRRLKRHARRHGWFKGRGRNAS